MNRLSQALSAKLPFFYGYVIVGVAVLAQIGSSPGQTFAVSAFTPALQDNLQLSSSQLATAYMLGTLLAAIPLALIGPTSDRLGLRSTLLAVAISLGLACWFMSTVSGFFSVFLGFLLLRFLGQGSLTLLSSNLVSMWFQRNLGTINAVMSAGGAMAFAIVPMLLIDAIEWYGWRATYFGMGSLILVTLVPAIACLARSRPEDLGERPDGGPTRSILQTQLEHPGRDYTLSEALRHRTFWILAINMSLWALIGTGIVFYALPIYADCGIDVDRAKLMFSTFSLSMIACQIAGGVLADRFPMHRLLAAGFGLLAIGTGVVPLTTGEVHVHLFGLCFGAGQGLAISVNSTMWVRYYGRTHLGKIRGASWCAMVAGSGCGPLILGLFKDYQGSFQAGLWLFFVVLLPLVPAAWLATAPPIKSFESDPANRPKKRP